MPDALQECKSEYEKVVEITARRIMFNTKKFAPMVYDSHHLHITLHREYSGNPVYDLNPGPED